MAHAARKHVYGTRAKITRARRRLDPHVLWDLSSINARFNVVVMMYYYGTLH